MKIEVSYKMPNGRVIAKRFKGVQAIIEDRGLGTSKVDVHFHNGQTPEVVMLPSNITWEDWDLQIKVLGIRDKKK